jgi:hypothetical protein
MTENMLTNNKKSMEMPKDVIRIGKSKKDRYCNCQKDKDKDNKTNKDLQNTRQKTKDRVNSGAPER